MLTGRRTSARIDAARWHQASKHREAIRLNPDDPEAHNNLGSALWKQGKYEEAEVAFREAIRLNPDDP